MTTHPPDALTRLVGDVSRFAAEHWGRAPMLRRTDEHFDKLLDVATVERLLVDLARTPTFRLVRDGQRLPPADYTLRTRVGGEVIDGVADVGRIIDELAHGATIVLQGLQRSWPPLAELCLALERRTSHAAQANAYLTPPGAAGLAEHADEHDVLVLQVAGRKCWEVDGLGQVDMGPGDVMYVPAGTRHAAHTLDVFSLHLTIGLLTTTYRDVLRRLLDGLPDESLDRPLPLGWTSAARAGAVDETRLVLDRAAQLLTEADAERVVGDEVRRRRQRARRRTTGRLTAVLEPASIDHDAYLRRTSDDPLEVVDDGATVVLATPWCRLRFPAAAGPSLRHLVEHSWFRVEDLPGLDADDRLVVARRLVREGVLELA